jgi:hypothetical protein
MEKSKRNVKSAFWLSTILLIDDVTKIGLDYTNVTFGSQAKMSLKNMFTCGALIKCYRNKGPIFAVFFK